MYFRQLFEQVIKTYTSDSGLEYIDKNFKSKEEFTNLLNSMKNNQYIQWFWGKPVSNNYHTITKKNNKFYHNWYKSSGGFTNTKDIILNLEEAVELLWNDRKWISKNEITIGNLDEI